MCTFVDDFQYKKIKRESKFATILKQEETAREERTALENIAAILATVTSKKIALVKGFRDASFLFLSSPLDLKVYFMVDVKKKKKKNVLRYQRRQGTSWTLINKRIRGCCGRCRTCNKVLLALGRS